jgi:hypothetical protein
MLSEPPDADKALRCEHSVEPTVESTLALFYARHEARVGQERPLRFSGPVVRRVRQRGFAAGCVGLEPLGLQLQAIPVSIH